MNPYQYVGDNPETHNDPSGHCWPLCTMLIGAAIGAVIGVASTVVTNAVQGKPTSMGQIAQAAVVGAVSGAIAGLAGPEAGPLAKVAIGALSSGAGQLVGNAMSGKPLMDGVAQATIVGGVTGGLVEGAGALVKGASGEAEAAEGAISEAEGSCGLSFRSDTLVATPTGEQAISTLNVGDHVQAYNPVTKKISTQTVQQVFINHDTDLMDVTLAVHPSSTQTKQQQAAVVSHGSHAPPAKDEVVHTTQKHPWLTTKGWITAGQLHLGNEVQLLDGATATVIGLKIVPGTAAMYDLTVSNVHTFAVGDGQFVVHNCTLTDNSTTATADERAAAEHVASLKNEPGDTVELRDPEGQRLQDGNTSDLLVNGKTYDIYSPKTSNVGRIVGAIASKANQARGIVLHLANTTLTEGDMPNLLGRVNGALRGRSANIIEDIIFFDPKIK
jgi:hypothetical protein